jgi:hypothetical protein
MAKIMPNYVKVKMLDGTVKEIDLDTCVKYEIYSDKKKCKIVPPKTFGEDLPKPQGPSKKKNL